MNYQGVRRCDVCSSEILGHGGADVCYLCRLIAAGDPDVVGGGNLEQSARSLLVVEGRRQFPLAARTRATALPRPTLHVIGGLHSSSAKTSMPRVTQ